MPRCPHGILSVLMSLYQQCLPEQLSFQIQWIAVKMVLKPIFEKEFLDIRFCSDGYSGEVNRLIKEGYTWVLDADLQTYFDAIPHGKKM